MISKALSHQPRGLFFDELTAGVIATPERSHIQK